MIITSVRVKKLSVTSSLVRSKVKTYIKPVAGETLHAVVDGQDVDPLAVLHVRAALDDHHVAESDSEVIPHSRR